MSSDSSRTPTRPSGRTTRPRRSATQPTGLLERYRSAIIGVVVVAAIVVVGAFALQGASASGYACSTEWTPTPTSEPVAGATPALGYVQPDQGRSHNVESPERYTLCPPASGSHRNLAGAGPIQARFYDADDEATPTGWIHNLEHGGLVILYRCDEAAGDLGCTDGTQTALRNLFTTFPDSPICGIAPGQIGPVIARFDEMAWPFAAIVWNRVLPLDSLDTDTIKAFFAQWGERTNPEQFCEAPTPTPGPSIAPSPTPTPAPSATPSTAPSASAQPSASTAPSASPEPSPTPS